MPACLGCCTYNQVYISTSKVDVGTAYLGVPLVRKVTMVNLSNLEVLGEAKCLHKPGHD